MIDILLEDKKFSFLLEVNVNNNDKGKGVFVIERYEEVGDEVPKPDM